MICRTAIAPLPLLIGLALAGCTEPADQSDDERAIQQQDLDGSQDGASIPAAADGSQPEVLGSLGFTARTQHFNQQVTECRLRATPESSQGLAWFWLSSVPADTPLSSSLADPAQQFSTEFQIQDIPNATGVALMTFANSAESVAFAGDPVTAASTANYLFSVDGSEFDIRAGSNGVLSKGASGSEHGEAVAVVVAFSGTGQSFDEASLNTAAETLELSLELTARCVLSWHY
ncbi:MAG: hypothetical protein ACR2PZ_26960 [Pseudomonadales bacterium]